MNGKPMHSDYRTPRPYSAPLDFLCPANHGRNFRRLVHAQWWRLLPCGIWTLRDGGLVVFDRDKSPIARLETDEPPHPLDPELWVPGVVTDKRFYEHAGLPHLKSATLPMLLELSKIWALTAEILLRWELSDFGIKSRDEWAQDWRRNAGGGLQ